MRQLASDGWLIRTNNDVEVATGLWQTSTSGFLDWQQIFASWVVVCIEI